MGPHDSIWQDTDTSLREEYVLTLQIAVQDVVLVDVLECKTDLGTERGDEGIKPWIGRYHMDVS